MYIYIYIRKSKKQIKENRCILKKQIYIHTYIYIYIYIHIYTYIHTCVCISERIKNEKDGNAYAAKQRILSF